MAGEVEPERGREVPDLRQYMRYVEQHSADSLDAAVADVEAWAEALLSVLPDGADVPYPSAAWFARQLRADLGGARRSIAADNARRAAWYALRVGELIVDARRYGFLDETDDPLNDDPIPPDPPRENSATP
jgi:hypothetical protein